MYLRIKKYILKELIRNIMGNLIVKQYLVYIIGLWIVSNINHKS